MKGGVLSGGQNKLKDEIPAMYSHKRKKNLLST